MKTFFLHFTFCILLMISFNKCKNKQIKNDILTIEKIEIKDFKEFAYDGINPLNIQQRGDSIIVNYYPDKQSLIIYSLKKNIAIDTIDFKNFYINSFYYINDDSILVLGDNYINNEKGVLFIIDKKGKINKQYHLSNENYYAYSCIFLVKNRKFTGKIVYKLQDVNLNRTNHYTGGALVACLDIYRDTIIKNENLILPYLYRNIYYPKGLINYYDINISKSIKDENSKVIISFKYTPTIYIWDVYKNSYEVKRIKSKLIDTILPCTKPCEKNDVPYYGGFYKLNDSLLLRLYTLDNKQYDKTLMCILLDSNYNYLGEFILNKNGPYIWHYPTETNYNFVDDKDNKLRLIKAQVYLKENSFGNMVDKLNEIKQKKLQENNELCKIIDKNHNEKSQYKNILNYFRKYHQINDSNFTVIVLHQYGCGSCNQEILNFISINQATLFKIKNNPFYLLMIGKKFIKISNNQIKVDTTNLYEQIHPFSTFNPRLILVKNNEIISDTVYMPDNIELLFERFVHYYN